MIKLSRLLFILISVIFFHASHAQQYDWMAGTWHGEGEVPGSEYTTQFIRTLIIDSVHNNYFNAVITSKVEDGKGTQQDRAMTGVIENKKIKLTAGKILYTKQPPYGAWWDCGNCKINSNLFVSNDSIILSNEVHGCGGYCDGVTKFHRVLSEFDAKTQQKIRDLFNIPSKSKEARPVISEQPKKAF